MRTRLYHLWDKLMSSYWFVPAVMLAAAVGLAFGMLTLDRRSLARPGQGQWLYAGGIEGARTLLSVVAGSIITVAGVVFSVTIVALTQASSQFGPRLLRSFMRDTGNQIVLGTFVSTFLYCVLVLRAIPAEHEGTAPHASVTVAVGLAVASLCVLVYFIHHVSFAIQAPQVVARVWDELKDSLGRIFPEALGRGGPPPEHLRPRPSRLDAPPPDDVFEGVPRPVQARRSGYVQAVDAEAVMGLATRRDLRLRVLHRPGKFVVEGSPLVLVWPGEAATDQLASELNDAFMVGRHRTPEQDVEFAISQMVEVAVRALSPGVNDPITAITCIDWLGEGLCRIAQGDLHSPYRYDDAEVLRVVTRVSSFAGITSTAFDMIRQYGRTSTAVTIRLLEVIATVTEHLKADEQRQALRRQADIIHRQSRDALPEEQDRADVDERYQAVLRALGAAA